MARRICQVQQVGKLFLLFTIIPLVELYLLGMLADVFGLWHTFALVVVTGMLGASLARAQGRQVLRDWQNAISQGRIPESGVTDALLVVVGGVLLVTPGVLTDAVGLSLLLPPPRRFIGRLLVAYFQRQVKAGVINISAGGGFSAGNLGDLRNRNPFGPAGPMGQVRPPGRPFGTEQPEVIHVKATVRDVKPEPDDSSE